MNSKIKIVLIFFVIVISVTAFLGNRINSNQINSRQKNTKTSNSTVPTNSKDKKEIATVSSENITWLDYLMKSFVFPPMASNLNLDESCPGLPNELINKLKEALNDNSSDSLILKLNDKSLMITTKDFTFKPNLSNDIDDSEKDLNEAILNGALNYLIYKCDTNGDRIDEIVMVEDIIYDYSRSNRAYILKKSGDKYIYAGHDFLDYYRCFALFKNCGKFYMVANYDDYNTNTTKTIRLFALNGNNSGFMCLTNNQNTYIQKTNDYHFHSLYKNANSTIFSDVQMYVNEIGKDLIYTDKTHKTFYGNETERDDLLEEWSDNGDQLNIENVNEVDVNNDKENEYFERQILYYGDDVVSETKVSWYNPKSKSVYPAPFTVWSPNQYILTQQWFKRIAGKTIIFSLYHKNSEEIYLLDARINEKGQTTVLLDYMINTNTCIKLSDYLDYEDTNFVKIDYKSSAIEKPVPEYIDERIKHLAAKVQGNFSSKNYKDKNIPNSLIILAEKALFNNKIDNLNLCTASFEINKDVFYRKYGQFSYYDNKTDFDKYISHIYKYSLNKNTYYLLVADSGGSARFVFIDIYKELDGELKPLEDWVSLDKNARVMKYNGNLYFIESSYNYYSKYTDTICIYKLTPDKIKDFVVIELKPDKFELEEVFSNHKPYRKNITSYVASIKDDLMTKSPIDDNIQVYLGDEKNNFDPDKKLRLKSVCENRDYYEIDFNNDGEPEYFERHFWFPSNFRTLYLISNFYKFTDTRTVSIDADPSDESSNLIQLWYKEIDGKIFTFRLFLNSGYNYSLYVSLVEGTNVTQVQSYIIVPKNKFNISTKTKKFVGM